MRYMVLTTRHHDGYSLFDSQVSDFTAPKTAAKRDLVRAYVEACHRGGMRVGFYYSLLDWRYPAYFRGPKGDPEGWKSLVDYMHAQVRELCTQLWQGGHPLVRRRLALYGGGLALAGAERHGAPVAARDHHQQPLADCRRISARRNSTSRPPSLAAPGKPA